MAPILIIETKSFRHPKYARKSFGSNRSPGRSYTSYPTADLFGIWEGTEDLIGTWLWFPYFHKGLLAGNARKLVSHAIEEASPAVGK